MALDADVKRLASIPILAELDGEALRLLAFSAETRVLRSGDVLFRKGETSNGGYVVTSGAVALLTSDDGRPATQTVGPGALVGEMALIAETVRPCTAIARVPTVVQFVGRALFHRVLHEYPGGAARLRAAIEGKLRDFASASAAEPPSR
jgi:CRP-like cAMP-binding protein